MTGRRRPPRRQGVVYGPLVQRNQRESTSLLGRVLGAVVIFGALVVLALGALAVIGGGEAPRPSASPTRAALASPSPSSTGLPTFAPRPTATPTAAATATPSQTASPFPVTVVEGPGMITFARDYNTDPPELIDRTVDFATSGPIAWWANIGTPVGRDRIDVTVSLINTADMSETVVHADDTAARNPDAVVFLRRSQVQRLVDGPGIYVMRYIHDGSVVAEGYFRVSD